jgi:hypothetical protein
MDRKISGLYKKVILTLVMILLEVIFQIIFLIGLPISYLTYLAFVGLAPLFLMAIYAYGIGRISSSGFFEGVISSFVGGLLNIVVSLIGNYIFITESVINEIIESFSSITSKNISASVEVKGGGNIVFNIVIAFIICVIFSRIGNRYYEKYNKIQTNGVI